MTLDTFELDNDPQDTNPDLRAVSPQPADAPEAVDRDVLEILYHLVERVYPDGAEKHEALAIIADHFPQQAASQEDQQALDERQHREAEEAAKQKELSEKANERRAKVDAVTASRDLKRQQATRATDQRR